MAYIVVEDLNVKGFNLLSDSESFLAEVSDRDMDSTVGGITPIFTVTAAWGTASVWGVTFGSGFLAGAFGAGVAAGGYAAYKSK